MVRFNAKTFAKGIYNSVVQLVRPQMVAYANEVFEQVKKDIIAEVRAHPVSLELTQHTTPSAFLNGRSGTLFGFLGFRFGDDPVGKLIGVLEEAIRPNIQRRFIGTLRINILGPSEAQLRGALALPWEGGLSWPEAVESGVSGLGSYLPIDAGRSKEGIQLKKEFRSVNFEPVPFLSEIFRKAQEKIGQF